MSLVGVIAGLAAVDSLNPFSIAAQAYLLGTPRATARSLVFVAGTWLAYFLGGLLVVRGLQSFVDKVMPGLPDWVLPVGECTLGVLFLGLAAYLWRRARGGKEFTPPKNLGLGATAVFAVATTVSDLPTAFPLFIAATRISETASDLGGQLPWLAMYTSIYIAPLLLLVVIHLVLGTRSSAVFGRVQTGVDWLFVHAMPFLLLAIGAWLVHDGGNRWSHLPDAF